MAKLTRQALLTQATVGAATMGALMTVPALATAQAASEGRATELAAHEPLMAYVRDAAKGEIAVLVGTREVIVRDHEMVKRLVKATR